MKHELDTKSFAERIKQNRGTLSYREVKVYTGIGMSTLHRLERGGMPSLQNYIALCDWMMCDYDKFIKPVTPSKRRLIRSKDDIQYVKK